MSNIRAKFIRGEETKYISHLDLMLFFERALRRAHISIAYSQGFNPHPHMVFGLPLSVGVTSEAEYADFEITDDMEPEEFIRVFNKELPESVQITDAKVKYTKDNIMASIVMASYDVLVSTEMNMGINVLEKKVKDFLESPTIIAKKEGKKGIKDIDIKPMIHKLEAKVLGETIEIKQQTKGNFDEGRCLNENILKYRDRLSQLGPNSSSFSLDNMFCLSMLLSAGSMANVKPNLLFDAFCQMSDLELKLVKIHRTGLFIGKEGNMTEPLDPIAL